MKQSICYFRPDTLEEALQFLHLHAGEARPCAGCTDVMVQLRENAKPMQGVRYLVDVSRLAALQGIAEEDGMICIGAAVTHSALCASPVLRCHAPFLQAAAATVGSTQIRNRGTVGGNICNASLAADTLSPLVAAEAELVVLSAAGERSIAVKDVFAGSNQNTLAADELAVQLRFKSLQGYNTAFVKLGRRKALAISRINAAVALLTRAGVVQQARIAPGCVFKKPGRAAMAEALLCGREPSMALLNQVGCVAAQEMIAQTGIRWSTEYKQPALEALIRRALQEALGWPQA